MNGSSVMSRRSGVTAMRLSASAEMSVPVCGGALRKRTGMISQQAWQATQTHDYSVNALSSRCCEKVSGSDLSQERGLSYSMSEATPLGS